jgi:hypothetical protein
MKREELRLIIRALEGDKGAIDHLEAVADNDSRWSKWQVVKGAASAIAALTAAFLGVKATVQAIWSNWK